MRKYLINSDLLKIGDVICTREDAPISRLIRKTLHCEYSHVMIYVAYSSCIHADGDGVHSINMQRVIFSDPKDVLVLRHKSAMLMAEDELEEICVYPRSKVGTEYSVPDALKSGVSAKSKLKPKVDSNYQYCSRLVAESFEYAGLKISSDPSVCTPADIQSQEDFVAVGDIVKEASQEDLDFASDDKINTISKQARITNNIIKRAQKIFRKDVQTFEDIFRELVIDPQCDELIKSLIQDSGYLTIWAEDVVKCPYRYFKTNYPDIRIIMSLDPEWLKSEVNFADKDARRFNIERIKLVELHGSFPRITFEQQINLYQTLLSMAIQRQDLFQWLLETNGAVHSE